MNKNEFEMRVKHIDKACSLFIEKNKKDGVFVCDKCPLHETGICDRIFISGGATDDDVLVAYQVMKCPEDWSKLPVLLDSTSAWDIIRSMDTKEYEDFKEFLYDKYASMCSLEDLINEFTNDELVHKYRVFKGVEEDV